jgi:hypothetical protein
MFPLFLSGTKGFSAAGEMGIHEASCLWSRQLYNARSAQADIGSTFLVRQNNSDAYSFL